MKKWTLLLLLLISNFVFAQTIYQWTDAQGNTVYSDKPQQGAQEVTVPDLPSYQAPKPAAKPVTQQVQKITPPQTIYKTLTIESPKAEATVWSNPGIIPVRVNMEPALAKGDKLIITVDGKTQLETSTSSSLELKGIERGTHSIQAKIIDPDGKVAKTSQAVTVYLHKASVNQMSPPKVITRPVNP